MWTQGLNKMYGAWTEGRQLIEYLRNYNSRGNNTVHYYGTDIGGFYYNWKLPLDMILKYLETVDLDYSVCLRDRLNPFMDFLSTDARLNYSENMSTSQQNALAEVLNDTLLHFDAHEEQYSLESSAEEFQWARQSMYSMRMAENYYRNYDNMKNRATSNYVGLNGREIAMACNAEWVLKQRGADAKVIWIEHVVHTKTKSQHQDGVWGFFTPAAQILRQSLKVMVIPLLLLSSEDN